MSPSKIAQFLKGKSSHRLQREFRELQKRYWGQHLWARGYFCATVGAVDEETVKRYVENQSDDEGSLRFGMWRRMSLLCRTLGGFIRAYVGFSLNSRL